MEKSFKYKEFFKEYRNSILIGSSVLLSLVAIASTLHHLITLAAVVFLIGACADLVTTSGSKDV